MFAFAASILALPLLARSVLAADCARSYTVAPGDTCDSISAANNASTYQLATVNPFINDDCTNLVPDEKLCLGFVGSDCNTTYVVQSGDSCAAIADATRMANATLLLTQNPNVDDDCSNIYVGEVLCISGGTPVPAPQPNKVIQKPVPVTKVPANPQATHAAVSKPIATPAPQDDSDDDEDDEDLPWCT